MSMNPIRRFFQQESAGGILLIIAALIALVMINTQALSGMYNGLLQTPVVVQIGGFIIAKPLLLWINDGLMLLAVLGDVGAIIIIALFYTADLSTTSLTVAGVCLVILFIMNRRNVMDVPAYLLVVLCFAKTSTLSSSSNTASAGH